MTRPPEVLLAGDPARLGPLGDALRASRRARVVEVAAAPDTTPEAALADALGRHPEAWVLVAGGPRIAAHAARALLTAGRRGVVDAPLASARDGTGALDELAALAGERGVVRVAHGWVSLPGQAWIAEAAARVRADRLRVRVAGRPDGPGDLDEAATHAAALLLALAPAARTRAVRVHGDAWLEAELDDPRGREIVVRVHAGAPSLEVEASGGGTRLAWSFAPDVERRAVERRGAPPSIDERAAPTAAARMLAGAGDDLARGIAANRLALAWLGAAGRGWPPGRAALARATSRARDGAGLRAYGIDFDPPLPASSPAALALPELPVRMEVPAFRAGRKPVVFLTVEPALAARARGWFEGAHVEVRERRVSRDAHDRWVDRRDAGEPHVELYVSRDPALARRAAELQAEGDPSRSLGELGELLGYPRCCIDAFAAQADRADNTANRYQTASRTRAARWAWPLADLWTKLVPFFPCRYDCPEALAQADDALAELERMHAGWRARLEAHLARPALFFAHGAAIAFDGATEADGAIRYRRALPVAGAPPSVVALAAWLGDGGRVAHTHDAWVVERDGSGRTLLPRCDPGLGLLAPFA